MNISNETVKSCVNHALQLRGEVQIVHNIKTKKFYLRTGREITVPNYPEEELYKGEGKYTKGFLTPTK
jgi:hypothetical protein